jgi:hypothetical protein
LDVITARMILLPETALTGARDLADAGLLAIGIIVKRAAHLVTTHPNIFGKEIHQRIEVAHIEGQ